MQRLGAWWAQTTQSFENSAAVNQVRAGRHRELIAAIGSEVVCLEERVGDLQQRLGVLDEAIVEHERAAVALVAEEHLAFAQLRARQLLMVERDLLQTQLQQCQALRIALVAAIGEHQQAILDLESAALAKPIKNNKATQPGRRHRAQDDPRHSLTPDQLRRELKTLVVQSNQISRQSKESNNELVKS